MADGGKVVIRIDGDTKGYQTSMAAVESTTKKSAAAAVASVAAIGVAVAAIGGSVLKVGTEFETSLAKVGTIADTTALSLDAIGRSVIALSNQTGESAALLNEATYQAISAGVDTASAVNFVEQSTQLARAGFTDTVTAVDVLTSALNAYGLEAGEAERVSDVLLTTQNLGKTTVNELSQVMGRTIPTAASLGVSIEQLGAAFAITTANGIQTTEAGTYLNSMLTELGRSGTDASDALLASTGKTFAELTQEGYSLGDVLAILQGEAEASGLSLQDMFGSAEAGRAALSLLSGGADGFNQSLEQMQNSAGATSRAFAVMDDTTAVAIQKIVNRVKNAGIEIYNSSEGTVNRVVRTVGDATEFLIDNMDTVGKAITVAGVAWGTWKTITVVTTGVKAFTTASAAALTTQPGLNGVPTVAMTKNTTAQALNTAAKAAGFTVSKTGALVTALGTTATQKETLAILLSSGAIGVKTVAVGVLNGTITLATAAQWAWNTAVLAHPAVALAVGVAAVTAGITALAFALNDSNAEMVEANEEAEQMAEAAEQLRVSTEESSRAFESELVALQAKSNAAKDALAEVRRLAEANDGTAASEQRLTASIQMANSILPGLGLSYNSATNDVEGLANATDEYAESLIAVAEAELYQERLNEVLEEQATAALALEETYVRMERLQESGLDSTVSYTYGMDGSVRATENSTYAMNQLLAAEQDQIDALEITTEQVGVTQEAINELTGATEDAAIATTEAGDTVEDLAQKYDVSVSEINAALADGISLDEWEASHNAMAEATEEANRRIEEAMQNLADAYNNANEQINLSDQVSLQQRIANLEHNRALVRDYQSNLDTITQAFEQSGVEMTDGLMMALQSGNEDAMRLAQDIATAIANGVLPTEGQVAQMNELLGDTGYFAGEAFGLGVSEYPIEEPTHELAQNTYEQTARTSERQDWRGIGTDMVTGIAEGIQPSVLSQRMAVAMTDAYNSAKKRGTAFDWYAIGYQMVQGIATGLQQHVVSQAMAQAVYAGFEAAQVRSVYLDWHGLGAEMINGMIGGINSKMGELEAAASRAADITYKATAKGLEVKSPSRKGMYLGEMYTEGIGIGAVNRMAKVSKDISASISKTIDYDALNAIANQAMFSSNRVSPSVGATSNVTHTSTTNNNSTSISFIKRDVTPGEAYVRAIQAAERRIRRED